MEYYISIAIFLFGIITWIPFLKTPYCQDLSSHTYYAGQVIRKKITLFKDVPSYGIGHFLHLIIIQFFFGKENKYYNRFMCLWCSFSAFIVYWVIYNLFGLTAAIVGGILYALYIVNPRIDGNWGPFETIMNLPLLASMFLLQQASKTDSLLLVALSGMIFGYTILIKQTAVLYFPGYILMVLGSNISSSACYVFGGSFFLVNLIPLIYYWINGIFWEYMASNWLVMLPSAINPKKYNKYYPKLWVRGEKNKEIKKQVILKNSISLLPVIFLTIITFITFIAANDLSLVYLGLTICTIASTWMIFMRGTLFPHYWLNMVPWLIIMASFSLSKIISNLATWSSLNVLQLSIIVTVFSLFTFSIYTDWKYYIPHKDPYGFIRKFNGDTFTQSNYITPIKIAEYIKQTTSPEDKILVCGWTPYIVLYSDRDSFTPNAFLYAEDYLDLYSKSNPNQLDFLNQIFKFKKFKIIKDQENPFKTDFPKLIVFSDGRGNISDFEKLTNMYYAKEEQLGGYPMFRADEELSTLMASFENGNNKSIQKTKDIDSNENELSNSLDPQDWNSALEIAKQLLKENPYNIEYLLTLGECLIGTGNYSLLFRFYNRLIENKMVSTTSRLGLLAKLGEAYCHQDKFKEAEEIFSNILKIKPENPAVLNNLGYVYSRQENNKKASLCFQKALELDPNNEDAMMNLEQIKAMC
jgi:Cytochrome c biogenesis factor